MNLNELRSFVQREQPDFGVYEVSRVVAMIDRLRTADMRDYYLGGTGPDRDRLAGLIDRRRDELRVNGDFASADLLRNILVEAGFNVSDKQIEDAA